MLKIIYKKLSLSKIIYNKRKKYYVCMCEVSSILSYSNVCTKHNDTDHAIASFSANFYFSICVNMNYIFGEIVFLFLFNPQPRERAHRAEVSVMTLGKVDGKANHEYAQAKQNRGIKYTKRRKSQRYMRGDRTLN